MFPIRLVALPARILICISPFFVVGVIAADKSGIGKAGFGAEQIPSGRAGANGGAAH